MNKIYQVYQVSDSTGETLDRIFLAIKSQFTNFEYKTIHHSFTRTKNQADKIISKCKDEDNSIILYTIVDTNLAKYLNVKYVVAMNNGTSTLDSLVKYFGIKKSSDEVIIPDLTYISTANVVTYNNGKLVLCDSNPNNFNINLEDLKKKITSKTKLIIVTDMKGMPVDYDELLKISKEKKIPVIADSAEALGAIYKKSKEGVY